MVRDRAAGLVMVEVPAAAIPYGSPSRPRTVVTVVAEPGEPGSDDSSWGG